MFQPEAMLLLLILAVLGTPTFSTEDTYYGTKTGTHFCTAIPEGKNLTGIRMHVRNNVIMSVQLKHGDSWGLLHGFADGTSVEVELNTEEHVIGALCTFGHFIQQMSMYTDRPREITFGHLRGRLEAASYPKKPGQVLQGFCGYFVKAGFKAIRFVWRGTNETCTA